MLPARPAVLSGVLCALLASASQAFADEAAAASRPWYAGAWRRAVIDMHIPDWDEAFLSEFDADSYVERLVASRAQSIVCYAHSHVGLFNYPTRVGRQHAGLKGRNVVGELIERCHTRGIAVVLYTSLIHDRWTFDEHPEWRMKRSDGRSYGEGSRYGVVCPNSPYRNYVRAWVEEICQRFDFEGIRFDMTFWVGVCYCEHCRKRFSAEVGGEIPTVVNWTDERWMRLQRQREEWMADFASVATSVVRRLEPRATVEHQASTFPLDWGFGVGMPLVAQNDFLQGDFYGDALQGSFVRKLLEDLTPNRPFAYETSFSVSLRDHTASKAEALLEAKASAAIADAAAFVFIDAIDPIGTVNARVHERMGRVFDRLMPYYQHLGGERVADAAIYYSLESKFSMKGNGRPADAPDRSDTHTASAMNAARRVLAAHLPLGVVTRRSLGSLARHKLLVLPNVTVLDDGEAAAIREFVRQGGSLYASAGTSLLSPLGKLRDDFLLGDVLGVQLHRADWQDREHYVAPTAEGQRLFSEYDARRPAFSQGFTMDVAAREGAVVLATRTLPWPAAKPAQFSSIHSNPPWAATERPELVLNRFGKGKAVYAASPLEDLDVLQETFAALLRSLVADWSFEVEAPAPVEATLFRQRERRRWVLSLVNFQKDLPNIPVDGIRVRLRLPGAQVMAVRLLPEGIEVAHERDAATGTVAFTAPRLETLAMFAVETERTD
jgi:hypothetical protein